MVHFKKRNYIKTIPTLRKNRDDDLINCLETRAGPETEKIRSGTSLPLLHTNRKGLCGEIRVIPDDLSDFEDQRDTHPFLFLQP